MATQLTRVYTDGSYSIKRQRGSYGVVLIYGRHEKHIKGPIYGPDSTSQRMEISAVIAALEAISKDRKFKYLFHIDSQYVVNAITKRWVFRWEKSDFAGYKNDDLWRKFLEEYRKFDPQQLMFKWVKGHVGNKYNEIADDLAGHWKTQVEQITDLAPNPDFEDLHPDWGNRD